MAKICIDTNIALDLVQKRATFYEDAKELIEFAIEGSIDLYFTESTLVNTLYVARQELMQEIIVLINACQIIHADKSAYIQAIESNFNDKEDAIQYYVALSNKCDIFITRDMDDFRPFASASLPVMTPKEFFNSIEPGSS